MTASADPVTTSCDLLRDFFAQSRAAQKATRLLRRDARVDLELEGEGPAHFTCESGKADIREGPAAQPDFTLRLPPRAVRELTERLEEDVGELGVEFMKLLLERDPSLKVRVHVDAPLSRLVSHGYLAVLALGGLKVALWLAQHGFRNPRAAIERLRHLSPTRDIPPNA